MQVHDGQFIGTLGTCSTNTPCCFGKVAETTCPGKGVCQVNVPVNEVDCVENIDCLSNANCKLASGLSSSCASIACVANKCITTFSPTTKACPRTPEGDDEVCVASFTCDGAGLCAKPVFRPNTYTCRNAGADATCDPAETCTGDWKCPADSKAKEGTHASLLA